jgi:hypothetical protein
MILMAAPTGLLFDLDEEKNAKSSPSNPSYHATEG